MNFSTFSSTLEKIEKTSSRNTAAELLAQLLKSLYPDEVDKALYMMQGRIVPRYVALEYNVASKLMIRALSKSSGRKISEIESLNRDLGDLGLVAEQDKNTIKKGMDVTNVYQQLCKIASFTGKNSQAFKVDKISNLINKCEPLSKRYVVRMILGNLRLGFSDKTVLDALSMIAIGDKSKRDVLDRAYGLRADIGFIAKSLFVGGLSKIEKMNVIAGIPIVSMLCERESSAVEIFKRMAGIVIQPKYDGLRCQIHYSDNGFSISEMEKEMSLLHSFSSKETVRIFSRNLENLTQMFPEVKQAIRLLKVKSIILDSEAVAYDPKTGRYFPFQETIQRKRKYEVSQLSKHLPVRIFAFDVLYLDGRDLTQLPLNERLNILKDILKRQNINSVVQMAPSYHIKTIDSFEKIFKEYVSAGVEGVVAKNPESIYLPGRRGFDWIKFKKSMHGFIVDTIDAVVLGYFRGRGVRAKFGIGAILVGIYDKASSTFTSMAKVGTGIKDEGWKKIKQRLDEIRVEKKPENVIVFESLFPNIWVRPEVVVVVEADEITKSPQHSSGYKDGRGFSLRFPRLKTFDRKDKSAIDITTVLEIQKLYKLQGKSKV